VISAAAASAAQNPTWLLSSLSVPDQLRPPCYGRIPQRVAAPRQCELERLLAGNDEVVGPRPAFIPSNIDVDGDLVGYDPVPSPIGQHLQAEESFIRVSAARPFGP
jgi:hypothetical protein